MPDGRIYLYQGDVHHLLRGHYSSVIARTDSFVNPIRLLRRTSHERPVEPLFNRAGHGPRLRRTG